MKKCNPIFYHPCSITIEIVLYLFWFTKRRMYELHLLHIQWDAQGSFYLKFYIIRRCSWCCCRHHILYLKDLKKIKLYVTRLNFFIKTEEIHSLWFFMFPFVANSMWPAIHGCVFTILHRADLLLTVHGRIVMFLFTSDFST